MASNPGEMFACITVYGHGWSAGQPCKLRLYEGGLGRLSKTVTNFQGTLLGVEYIRLKETDFPAFLLGRDLLVNNLVRLLDMRGMTVMGIELSKPKPRPSVPQADQVADCLREFVGDVEAAGIEQTQSDWPDLMVTYNRAKKLLRRLGDGA